jgi:hypothetical protein
MGLDLLTLLSHPKGMCPRNYMSYPPPKNVCMYKEMTDKIAESFIAMLYISATIVLSNGESPVL